MKHKYIFRFWLFLLSLMVLTLNLSAQSSLKLDLQAYPKDTLTGGYWADTYNSDKTSIEFGEFIFSHSSSWGGSYWDGFTYATNGDNTNYGTSDITGHIGSTNWISNQWGVMAGGGLNLSFPVSSAAP